MAEVKKKPYLRTPVSRVDVTLPQQAAGAVAALANRRLVYPPSIIREAIDHYLSLPHVRAELDAYLAQQRAVLPAADVAASINPAAPAQAEVVSSCMEVCPGDNPRP